MTQLCYTLDQSCKSCKSCLISCLTIQIRNSALVPTVPRKESSILMLHPLAWLGWLAAALVALSLTRNPLYVVLVLLCIAIVGTVARPAGTNLSQSRPIRLIVVLIGF